jgi:hypothetical protein
MGANRVELLLHRLKSIERYHSREGVHI